MNNKINNLEPFCTWCQQQAPELCYQCGLCENCCNDPEHWEEDDDE